MKHSTRHIFGIDCALAETSTLGRLAAFRPLAVGVATEVFAAQGWPRLVECATRWSRTALELSALTAAELVSAVSYVRAGGPPVRYLSVHAPVMPVGEPWLLAQLREAQSWFAAVIQHPHTLADPVPLSALGPRLLLENMDAQKPTGRVVKELEPYFRSLPDAGFCLDVAHVRTVDPSMRLGHELIDVYASRLREVHVSAIDGDCTHLPLDAASIELYAPLLRRCRHVPWILESLPADLPAT